MPLTPVKVLPDTPFPSPRVLTSWRSSSAPPFLNQLNIWILFLPGFSLEFLQLAFLSSSLARGYQVVCSRSINSLRHLTVTYNSWRRHLYTWALSLCHSRELLSRCSTPCERLKHAKANESSYKLLLALHQIPWYLLWGWKVSGRSLHAPFY